MNTAATTRLARLLTLLPQRHSATKEFVRSAALGSLRTLSSGSSWTSVGSCFASAHTTNQQQQQQQQQLLQRRLTAVAVEPANSRRQLTFRSDSKSPVGRKGAVLYKTPTNSTRTFKPTFVAVTRANQHLQVQLHDQRGADLGVMTMRDADDLASKAQLKLVIVDEQPSTPHFQLMSGSELFQLQMKMRQDERADKEHSAGKELKEKEVDINIGISDNDLDIKLKMIRNFYEKGHAVKIIVKNKIANKEGKNVAKLQADFESRFIKAIDFAKVKVLNRSDYQVRMNIESKFTEIVKQSPK